MEYCNRIWCYAKKHLGVVKLSWKKVKFKKESYKCMLSYRLRWIFSLVKSWMYVLLDVFSIKWKIYLSRVTTKQTMRLWPAWIQTSLRIRAVWSGFSCSLTNPITSSKTDSEQHGSWSDCAEAQAGLDPYAGRKHIILVFCRDVAHFILYWHKTKLPWKLFSLFTI
jgi:hypothetical protein